jgi:Flp pilus assembly CpaE family ATPase
MTDDLVKRLKEGACLHNQLEAYDLTTEAADRIEQLERALLDVAQYASIVDLGFLAKPETRKVLDEIWENKDD